VQYDGPDHDDGNARMQNKRDLQQTTEESPVELVGTP